MRTVQQCGEAGLVDGRKIHLDSSPIAANASKDSILKSSPELIAAYKKGVAAQQTKLDETATPESDVAVNDTHVSTTAPTPRCGFEIGNLKSPMPQCRPRHHHHRAIDDAHGVITAVATRPAASPRTTS